MTETNADVARGEILAVMYDPSERRQQDRQPAIWAGLVYFAVVFAAGFVLGTLRVFVLIPLLGETMAVLLELPVILVIAWLTCRRLVAAFDVAPDPMSRVIIGGVGFVTLMGAECSLSVLAFGRSLTDHLDQYRQLPALLGLAGQIVFGLFPLIRLQMERGSRRS